jgi:hypothetical protein
MTRPASSRMASASISLVIMAFGGGNDSRDDFGPSWGFIEWVHDMHRLCRAAGA